MTKAKQARRTQAQWVQLIEGQCNSELTIEAYCKQHQVTVSNFYAWRAKLKKQSAHEVANRPASKENDWIPLVPPPSPLPQSAESAWAVELDLPAGITLRVRSA